MSDASLLDRLDAWLRRYRAAYHAQLRQGANTDELAAAEAAIGHSFPPALATFFRWRAAGASGRLQDHYELLHLDDVVDWHRAMTERRGAGELAPGWWRSSWIPFLGDGDGNYLCVDAADGTVIDFRHDDPDRTIEYPSFEAWLETFVVTLEAGAWKLDAAHDCFAADARRLASARARIAPGHPHHRTAADL